MWPLSSVRSWPVSFSPPHAFKGGGPPGLGPPAPPNPLGHARLCTSNPVAPPRGAPAPPPPHLGRARYDQARLPTKNNFVGEAKAHARWSTPPHAPASSTTWLTFPFPYPAPPLATLATETSTGTRVIPRARPRPSRRQVVCLRRQGLQWSRSWYVGHPHPWGLSLWAPCTHPRPPSPPPRCRRTPQAARPQKVAPSSW